MRDPVPPNKEQSNRGSYPTSTSGVHICEHTHTHAHVCMHAAHTHVHVCMHAVHTQRIKQEADVSPSSRFFHGPYQFLLCDLRNPVRETSAFDNEKRNCWETGLTSVLLRAKIQPPAPLGCTMGLLGPCTIPYTRGGSLLGTRGFRAQMASGEGRQGAVTGA